MYFTVDLTTEEFKVQLANGHFEGKPMQLHHAFAKSIINNYWPT